MPKWCAAVAGLLLILSSASSAGAQRSGVESDWERLVKIPAVSGYEQELAAEIRARLKDISPKTDNLGNVYVTLGSGAPHRLIVTPMDEPGYVISAITADGFLRVQRLPQQPPNAVFDTLHFAQPVWVMTRSEKKVPGVFAGLSVHLQSGRQNAPRMNHPDEMYVDVGAISAEEVRKAGVDLLDPIALNRSVVKLLENEYTSPAIGDRAGSIALIRLLRMLRVSDLKLNGTLTIAFVTQQWSGARGLARILRETSPDELIYVGRLLVPREAGAKQATGASVKPGSGVLLALQDMDAPLSELAADLERASETAKVKLSRQRAGPLRLVGYTTDNLLPKRTAQIGVPIVNPVTPAEVVSLQDVGDVQELLFRYVAGPQGPTRGVGGGSAWGCGDCGPPLIGLLTESYGASGHEAAVREEVQRQLPEWARKKTERDAAGNLILHMGEGKADAKTPRIVFVAHMDEIGYEVKKVEDDGRLLVDVLGGGFTEYFLGHAVLVHKADRNKVGGVLELPNGWDQPGFEWPRGPRTMDEPVHVYVGTRSAEETQKLGIKAGDWVTIPKEYRPLLGTRANARSFDDRVGCAALIEAVKALGPNLPGRDISFIWSTEEEVGLKGAAAAAERMAKENRVPDFVFAIDTFVSSNSPLESKRFADAEIGKGFVVRAVDNSNITPREYVDRVVKLARENTIPVQYGVTGGGNDGSVFLRYGSVDIPLGWPLRYSHSPGEVIDTRDLDALARIIAVLAKAW